jgi:hypothetical protein
MNLEGDKRLNLQLGLDFSSVPTGEARQVGRAAPHPPPLTRFPAVSALPAAATAAGAWV